LQNWFHKLVSLFHDGDYFRLLVKFALPIALQNLITSSLNMVAVMMLGQLGEESVAAVGLANQVWFLLNLVVFGVVSGAAMFVAQLWGKRDVANIRRVLGLTVKLGLLAALLFWSLSTFVPSTVLKLYTEDVAVIALGSRFLRIFGWSFGFYAVSAAYYVALRSTGNVRLPLVVSISALGLNILLAYPLIFGIHSLGIPSLGVEGAALAGLIARVLECVAVLAFVYRDPTSPIAASMRNLLEVDLKFAAAVLKPILPVIANETLWSFGITTYNVIYGHISTDAVAAINIVSTIDQMAFVLFLGIGTATAIMVGNLIGEGEKEKAFQYAGRSLFLQGAGAMLMGVLVFLFAGNFLQFYKVSPAVIADARAILTVLSIGMWVRASNHVIIIGILRSGGDTRFSLVLDGLVIWFVGVPITALGAFVFGLPIHLVYALTLSEEATKYVVGLWRYFSKRWINDLTGHVPEISPSEAQ
jgi:putative MATE family efflux protein